MSKLIAAMFAVAIAAGAVTSAEACPYGAKTKDTKKESVSS